MKNSLIYHGGSSCKNRFSASSNGLSKDSYPWTAYISNDKENLNYGDAINPPDRDSWPDTFAGTYLGETTVRVKYVWAMMHRFSTVDSENDFSIRFRRLTADGTKSSAYSVGDGTIVDTLWFPNMGSTNGFIRWFNGASWNLNWNIPTNQALFCYVYFNGYQVVSGINVWLWLERTSQLPVAAP